MTEGGRRRCSGFLFFGCLGVIRGVSLSGRGVRVCSALFRFVRGVLVGLTVATLVNPWQPGVNRCQHLAACGKRMAAGSVGEGASASLWGERHRAALLF